jgi:hypothetical protein
MKTSKPSPETLDVSYQGNLVILCGTSDAIYNEARRIIDRFASSGRPLRIQDESPHRIILAACP